MRKRKILRFFGIALLAVFGVLVFLSITGTVAHAAGLVDTTVNDANAYSKYPLENYQLDLYVDSSWMAALELAGRYREKYSVWLVRHHQLYLDSEPLYLQCHRLCGAGGLQAGLYL